MNKPNKNKHVDAEIRVVVTKEERGSEMDKGGQLYAVW